MMKDFENADIEAAFNAMAKEEAEKSRTPYLPSNGIEMMGFQDAWCEQCIKHPINPESKQQCRYLGTALIGKHNGKWFRDIAGGTFCTAFRDRAEIYRLERMKRRGRKADPRQQGIF